MFKDTEDDGTVRITGDAGGLVGEIKMWVTNTAPSGYLLCNGGSFSALQYPVLATLLGNTFGTRSGDTCWLPDFRGRVPLGPGGQFPVQEAGWNIVLGQKYGHVKMQAHTHSGTTNAGHAGTGYASVPEAYYTSTYGLIQVGSYQGRPMVWMNSDEAPHAHGFVTNSTGGGNAENIQPILGIQFIIKAG